MVPEACTVADLFQGQRQYIIPIFQRNFEWPEERLNSLWQDIISLTEERDNRLNHFIGPMVIMQTDSSLGAPKYTVIDGQQRLISLTLILAGIRERAYVLGLDNLIKSIDHNYLKFPNTNGDDLFKVEPRIQDKSTLYNILLRDERGERSNSLLHRAFEFFLTNIVNSTPTQGELFSEPSDIFLNKLYLTLIHRLKVVLIRIEPGDNPSNIYESLNFKSEKLSDADLIKNFLYMKAGDHAKQTEFDEKYWKQFESLFDFINPELRNEAMTDFYYHYYMYKKEYIAKKTLYVHFTDFVRNFLRDNKIDQLMIEILSSAKIYNEIVHYSPEPDIEEALKRLRFLSIDTVSTLVLAIYFKYKSNQIDRQTFLRMLKITESFILRRFISKLRTRGYGLDFELAKNYLDSFDSLKKYYIEKKLPSDDEIKQEIRYFEIYKSNSVYTRLILSEIESFYGHKEKVDLTDKDLTIEHVMPQNLTSEWFSLLGDNAAEDHAKYLHTIGNLTLSGYNNELSNLSFNEKKGGYANSKLELNKYFLSVTMWNAEKILQRSDQLASAFCKIWEGPDQVLEQEQKVKKSSFKKRIPEITLFT